MKTFQEFVVERQRLDEMKESENLRKVMIGNMGLERVINDKTGEEIPLLQLDYKATQKRLEGSALWDKLSPKVQNDAGKIFLQPQNKRLRELLDVLTSEPLNIPKVMGKDDEPAPQTAPPATPQ